jgi:hypothetical protein
VSQDASPEPSLEEAPSGEATKYESTAVIGAVLLTLIAPLIALVAALVLRSSQGDETKKKQVGVLGDRFGLLHDPRAHHRGFAVPLAHA